MVFVTPPKIYCEEKTRGPSVGPLPVPNFTFIGATCRPCVAKKTVFRLLSKNNTGMAALHAGLSVKMKNNWLPVKS